MAQRDETPTTSDFFCHDEVAEIFYAAVICPDVNLLLPIVLRHEHGAPGAAIGRLW